MVDFTDRLRIEQQDTGSNQNTWGSVLNTDALAIIDEAFGLETIALTGVRISADDCQRCDRPSPKHGLALYWHGRRNGHSAKR
jgi:hypothetical protein